MTTTPPLVKGERAIVTVPDGPFTAELTVEFQGFQHDYDTGRATHELWRVIVGSTHSRVWEPGDVYCRPVAS